MRTSRVEEEVREPKVHGQAIVATLRNTGVLLSSLPLVYAASLLSLAYAARVLEPEGFGLLRFATAISSYFLLVGDLGLPLLGTRQVAAHPAETSDWVDRIVSARLVTSLGAMLILVVATVTLPIDGTLRATLLVSSLTLPVAAISLRWFHQGRERMFFAAGADAVSAIVAMALLVLLVSSPADVPLAAAAAVLGIFAASSMLMLAYRRTTGSWPRLAATRILATVRVALPLGVSGLLIGAYYNADTVLLGLLATPTAVGLYGGALRLVTAGLIVPWTFFAALLPALSRHRSGDIPAFERTLRQAIALASLAAVPVVVGGVLLAEPLVTIVLGPEYSPAASAVAILSMNVGVILISGTIGTALVAAGDEKWYVGGVAAGAAVNLVLNVALIPILDINGAAIARLATESVVFSVLLVRARSLANLGLSRSLRAPTVAGAGMAGTLILLGSVPLALQVAGAIAAYLLVMGLISPGYLMAARDVVRYRASK